MGAKHSVTLRMGSEPPLPVRMGAKHSVILTMGSEPPLPMASENGGQALSDIENG